MSAPSSLILQEKWTLAAKLGSHPEELQTGEEGLTLPRDFAGL